MNQYDQLESKLSNALDMLQGILAERLDNYGIYYRMFCRIKTGASIQRKLETERYQNDPDRKISDLFGIRITLYYQDDVEAVQAIVENMLEKVRWKETDNDTNTFDAQKNNGTFVLPGFVEKIVQPEIEGLRIAPHLEIQIRTVLFEAWHEAEHDMRYKEIDLWEDFPKESRKLNSILATLEMCDQYMVTLLDDVGHDFYKGSSWSQMIKYRYRMKYLNSQLGEKLEGFMTIDLAKQIFKWNKVDLIKCALEKNVPLLDSNAIVYLANECNQGTDRYIPEIREEYFAIRRQMSQSKKDIPRERTIQALREETAFDARVEVDCSQTSMTEQFDTILHVVYDVWMKKELAHIFPEEFAQPIHAVRKKTRGITCKFKYDSEHNNLVFSLIHPGLDAPGKTWKLSLEVHPAENGNLALHCRNHFLVPENAPKEVLPFSRPKVYQYIGRNVQLYDKWPLQERIGEITEEGYDDFLAFLTDRERSFPVILITVPSEEERVKSDSLYAEFVNYANNPKFPTLTNLMRKVGFVCHTYFATEAVGRKLAQRFGEEYEAYANGIRFFTTAFDGTAEKGYFSFTEEEICNRPKDIYALRNKKPYFYQCVEGPDAMRHEIIQMVYSQILGADIDWEEM